MRLLSAILVLATTACHCLGARTLAFDATAKEFYATPGQTNAPVTFVISNVAAKPITLFTVKPSCGCTYVYGPKLPLTVAAGTNHTFVFNTDLRGKAGKLYKTATVYSSAGRFVLTFTINIPHPLSMGTRRTNMQIAENNRQAVFSGSCGDCHAKPTIGKHGGELYTTACGICHEAKHRADMVPDLSKVPTDQSAEFWRTMISKGRNGTLMPGFSKGVGGPLTTEQIESLVRFMKSDFNLPETDALPENR